MIWLKFLQHPFWQKSVPSSYEEAPLKVLERIIAKFEVDLHNAHSN